MSLGCVKGRRDGGSVCRGAWSQLHLTLVCFTPEGLCELVHMGREISNLQGIFEGLKPLKMLCLESLGHQFWAQSEDGMR